MAITEFEITGNVRLGYNGIKSVVMTPAQKLQMILGTNGSGKSTIMSELSPLAAKHTNYERGGKKRTTHHHRGSVYECLSDFSGPKNHFELIKDGQVIYAGHSSEAYNGYVQQEFNMTQEVHDIRTGKKRLSTMDTETRRKLFTRIATEDYTYAIGYYKRLATATRDISGTIKRLNVKLMQEKAKLIDADEEIQMRKEIKELNEQKAYLLQHWRPMEASVESLMDKVDEIDVRLKESVNAFRKTLSVFCNSKGYKSPEQLWESIAEVQGNITYLNSKLTETFEAIESKRSLVDQARDSMNQDIGDIDKKLAEVSREIVATRMSILTGDDWSTEPDKTLSTYEDVFSGLMESMNELKPDPDLLYTPLAHKERYDRITLLDKQFEEMTKFSRDLSEKISLLDHRRQEGHTECPKCKHMWSRGFDQVVYDDLRIKLDSITKKIEDNRQEYTDVCEVQTTSSEQLSHYNVINSLARSTRSLEPMWKRLSQNHFMRISPDKAVEFVKSIRREIDLNVTLANLKAEFESLSESKKTAMAMSGMNQKELLDQAEALDKQLFIYQRQIDVAQQELESLQKVKSAVEYQNSFTPAVEDLLMRREEFIHKAELANHHQAVNSVMMGIDSMISQKEAILAQINAQHLLIQTLENEINDSIAKEKVMTSAMKTLSPTTGLIAKGLTGFINHFIAQMNAVIEKVWLYPLSILPIQITEDTLKLDYNFAFSVNGHEAGKDIALGSGAQVEIFDLAFMLVSMIHFGMSDSEIFLDEFSIRMDYAHRKEAMKMVTDLLISSNFSQVFMISHYESSYGSAANADITVLCPENIHLPSGLVYNNRSTVSR